MVDELSPTHAEQQRREQILASLERFIRKEYNGEPETIYCKQKSQIFLSISLVTLLCSVTVCFAQFKLKAVEQLTRHNILRNTFNVKRLLSSMNLMSISRFSRIDRNEFREYNITVRTL